MKSIFLTLLAVVISFNLKSQNIFPVKLENCKTDRFCMDCGDTKVSYQEMEFEKLLDKLNKSLNLNGITGSVKFQILVDAKGKGCVLSHNDQSNNAITIGIIKELNKFNKWNPAITNGKVEEKTSITLIFAIKDNKLTGQIERVDIAAFLKSFDRPVKPEIYNKDYVYNNENLKNYKITVWNTHNSNLPNNMNDNITIDKNGMIWLTADKDLVVFDGKEFQKMEQNITDKGNYFRYYAVTTDNDNTKWIFATNNVYSYNDNSWTKYDSAKIGTDYGYKIINNPKTEEVFFCSDKGLVIYKNGNWSKIDSTVIKELPSNRVYFAKRDSKNRIWIGTFSGSIVIEENGDVTNFEKTKTVLKGQCINSMDEDENGNLYFALYEFNAKDKSKVNKNEGIAIRGNNGDFVQYTTENSGMPFNHTNCVLYDKKEKVLWISTDRAGLVRYDLKNGWENYHNENSDIPTSYISTMTFDNDGNLYLATRQGLVKIERE